MSIVASVLLIPVVSIAVAFVALQIFLSLKPNKWLGLILPIIHFLVATMIFILNVSVVTFVYESMSVTVLENTQIAVESEDTSDSSTMPGTDTAVEPDYVSDGNHISTTSVDIMGLLGTFLLLNIPTIVDLGIYILCRRNVAKRNEVDKMKIQDL